MSMASAVLDAELETRVQAMETDSRNIKRVVLFALGGHIATQNASFKRLIQRLEPSGYRFYGAKDGFKAFETGEVYELDSYNIPEDFAGFVAGAGRETLLKKDGSIDWDKVERAKDFFKRGGFDIAVGSGGDDHGIQMDILNKNVQGLEVYVLNKTMDNDLGGIDGFNGGPYTDFTNGFHTAVRIGVQALDIHRAGAWTNNCPYLVGVFGRESNWVGVAVSYFGNADRFIYGELPEEHPGHSVERIHDLILESQDSNEKKYGRRFAMVVVAEGGRISGIEHVSKDLIDAHGHHKLNPESLVIELKKELEKRFKMKTQTAGVTYEMRNSHPTDIDAHCAKMSADVIAEAILEGRAGVESNFKINGPDIEDITAGTALIEQVSQKRFCDYYERANGRRFVNPETFEVTPEIGNYYRALFGKRRDIRELLPAKQRLIGI